MSLTTKQKLAVAPWLSYMIDNLPDPVKLSPGLDADENNPVLHLEWYVPPKSPPEVGSVND